MPSDLHHLALQWGRHPVEAFIVLGEGLRHASRQADGKLRSGLDRHLSAAELVQGVVDLMCERCGLLAGAVLRSWGIHTADDLGDLTFFLIEQGVLGKQEGDRREDFHHLPPLAEVIRERVREQLDRSLAALP
ncbi:MAG: hypothetical protein EA402_01760 [Planctomycetota bacterium]|nr:MAG: hypothetical protein EA402_01760 [Planctomycetota bacterium]